MFNRYKAQEPFKILGRGLFYGCKNCRISEYAGEIMLILDKALKIADAKESYSWESVFTNQWLLRKNLSEWKFLLMNGI